MDAKAPFSYDPQASLETELRQRLEAGFLGLLRLPGEQEAEFQEHARERATQLITKSVYLLLGLFLMVVLPISWFSTDPALRLWQASSVLPIALALSGIWLATRLPPLRPYVQDVLGLAVVASLSGTLYGALHMGNTHFGQMAAFETIYILIIVFSVLRLPTLFVLQRCLLALVLALGGVLLNEQSPLWLHLFLYFAVPLLICSINGYMLEYAERRGFVQTWLLGLESQRLAATRQQAEQEARLQQRQAQFQGLIAGNLSRQELFGRSLRFLLSETDSLVGAAYRLNTRGQLELLSQWGAPREGLLGRERLQQQATLMGPALARREILSLQELPADYLPIRTLGQELSPGHVLIVPVFDGEQAVAALELGKFAPYSAEDRQCAAQIVAPFAHAILAAEARAQLERREVLETA